jgi:hypothetical protein
MLARRQSWRNFKRSNVTRPTQSISTTLSCLTGHFAIHTCTPSSWSLSTSTNARPIFRKKSGIRMMSTQSGLRTESVRLRFPATDFSVCYQAKSMRVHVSALLPIYAHAASMETHVLSWLVFLSPVLCVYLLLASLVRSYNIGLWSFVQRRAQFAKHPFSSSGPIFILFTTSFQPRLPLPDPVEAEYQKSRAEQAAAQKSGKRTHLDFTSAQKSSPPAPASAYTEGRVVKEVMSGRDQGKKRKDDRFQPYGGNPAAATSSSNSGRGTHKLAHAHEREGY